MMLSAAEQQIYRCALDQILLLLDYNFTVSIGNFEANPILPIYFTIYAVSKYSPLDLYYIYHPSLLLHVII